MGEWNMCCGNVVRGKPNIILNILSLKSSSNTTQLKPSQKEPNQKPTCQCGKRDQVADVVHLLKPAGQTCAGAPHQLTPLSAPPTGSLQRQPGKPVDRRGRHRWYSTCDENPGANAYYGADLLIQSLSYIHNFLFCVNVYPFLNWLSDSKIGVPVQAEVAQHVSQKNALPIKTLVAARWSHSQRPGLCMSAFIYS